MQKEEVSKRYQIPISILDEYESWGLCNVVKIVMGNWQYDEEDLERLSMIMALHDIGFSNEEVKEYMTLLLAQENTEMECLAILTEKREESLEVVHLNERKIERIDYLKMEIKKNK